MEWAVILAVIEAIGKIAGAINEIYKLYQNIDEFSRNPDWFNDPNGLQRQQYEDQMEQIIISRQLVLGASAAILEAISRLNKTIFLSDVSGRLGEADAALQALDNWTRTKSDGGRDSALNDSAIALATMLQYSINGAYPNTSLVVPLFQILLIRLVVLTQTDPSFNKSSIARKPIEDSIKLIRSTADILELEICNKNKNNAQEFDYPETHEVRFFSAKEGGGRWVEISPAKFFIHYQNVSGTVRYGRFLSGSQVTDLAKQQLHENCMSAVGRGIVDDLNYYQIYAMRNIADMAEKILNHYEIYQLSKILGRNFTFIERAEFRILRRSYGFRESASAIIDKYFDEDYILLKDIETIREYGNKILARKLTSKEGEALFTLAKTFGAKAVLRTLLDNPDSVLK